MGYTDKEKGIVKGSLVNTDRGLCPIEQLTSLHKILTIKNKGLTYLPIKSVNFSGSYNSIKITSDDDKSVSIALYNKIYCNDDSEKLAIYLSLNEDLIVYNDKIPRGSDVHQHAEGIVKLEFLWDEDVYTFEIDDDEVHYGFINNIMVYDSFK
jgi:hypothetical protein